MAYGETYKLSINITRCSNNYGPYQNVVVGKIGTSTVSEKELIETYNSIYSSK